jgi:hypothetical protein
MKHDVVMYEEGSMSIVDTVNAETGLSSCFGETLQKVQERYPRARIMSFDRALEHIREAEKERFPMLKPVEITEEQFDEMFECLPPAGLKTTPEGISFKMSELTCGTITQAYAVKNGKHYEMYARINTPHEMIMSAIA